MQALWSLTFNFVYLFPAYMNVRHETQSYKTCTHQYQRQLKTSDKFGAASDGLVTDVQYRNLSMYINCCWLTRGLVEVTIFDVATLTLTTQ